MRRRTGRYFIEVSNGDEVCRTREDMLDGVVRSVNCDCRCLYFNDYKEGHSKQEVVLVIIEFQKLWDFYINNIAAAEIAEAESSFVMPRVKIYWETYPETADLDKQSRFSREHIVIDAPWSSAPGCDVWDIWPDGGGAGPQERPTMPISA